MSTDRRSNGFRVKDVAHEGVVRPRKRTRPPKPKIVKWMFHVSDGQREEVKQRLEGLHALGGDYALAELQRVAVELLLELSTSDTIRYLERQRDAEEAASYGYGNRQSYP